MIARKEWERWLSFNNFVNLSLEGTSAVETAGRFSLHWCSPFRSLVSPGEINGRAKFLRRDADRTKWLSNRGSLRTKRG
ncbi:MAG: hypothetical protein ACTS4Z_01010 [Candidatus Hodgkinia cicadicola]